MKEARVNPVTPDSDGTDLEAATPGHDPTDLVALHLSAAGGETLSSAAQAAAAAGMPANTRRAYADSLKQYIGWAESSGRRALPSTTADLTEFATWAAYTKGWAMVTIERARWAIIKWHKLTGAPTPSTSGLVLVLKGYREHLAVSHSPKGRPRKATPARRDSLAAMTATLDRSTLVGKRDAFIILVGFAIAGRRAEIASLNIESFAFRAEGMEVSVYRKKTRKDDTVVAHRRNDDRDICPVHAAEDLIGAMAGFERPAGPALVRIDRHGRPAHPMTRNGAPIGDPEGRMTGQAVAQVIGRCAVAAGLMGIWTGNSLRRGLATSMHEAGQQRENIERQGGWDPGSIAVAGYIEGPDRWLIDVLDGSL